ncbi:hypothetical protein PtrARCrB10_07651 [Pyrenophora tritici-repentis]|nr:hypothetical protein PtrARCrB10_07651 [Pyrenophora tritici-repentis]
MPYRSIKDFFSKPEPLERRLPDHDGWYASEMVKCPPILIAHSAAAAVTLLRSFLPAYTLEDNIWHDLFLAATKIAPRLPLPAHKCQASLTQTNYDPNGKRRRLPSVAKDDAINDTVSEPAIEPTREQGRSQYITRTTTTNNNQMSERQRPRRHEVAEAKAPPSRDEIAEQIAHRSINVDDAPVISWILDQPMKDGGYFLSTVRHPYATAAAMLRCARQFGNPGAKKVAA